MKIELRINGEYRIELQPESELEILLSRLMMNSAERGIPVRMEQVEENKIAFVVAK